MSVLKNIKEKYRNYFFRKRAGKVKRHKKVISYFEANYVGVLYDASVEENYNLTVRFTKDLQQDGKKVETLGYIRQKKKDRPEYSFPKVIFGFFSGDDFKWDYKINSNCIESFVNNEFDVLIDLSPNDAFPTKYIAGLSKAKYKVGLYSEKYLQTYDLLINVSESCSMEELAEHSIHYLKTINSKKTYA